MKRLILGLCVLALLMFSGAWVSHRFGRIHRPIAGLLWQAVDAGAEADVLAEQARIQWEQNRHFIAAFADHGPMDEIDSLFAQMDRLPQSHRPALYARLASLLEALAESHSLTWWMLL